MKPARRMLKINRGKPPISISIYRVLFKSPLRFSKSKNRAAQGIKKTWKNLRELRAACPRSLGVALKK